MKRGEEGAEGAAREGLVFRFSLVAVEGLQAAGCVDAFRFVREENRVAVEGDAQLAGGVVSRGGRQDGGGGNAGFQGLSHVVGVGREEQVGAEGADVAVGALAAREGGAGDV